MTGRFNTVTMLILPKLIDMFNTIPLKIPARFFVYMDRVILKSIWKNKGTRAAKTILKKKNKVRGITLSNVKTYYIAIVIKTNVVLVEIDTQINGAE